MILIEQSYHFQTYPQTAALEAVYKWISGEDVNFSEQYFVDCTFPFSGCEGGSANDAYDVTMMRQFIPSAEQDAYIADCKYYS